MAAVLGLGEVTWAVDVVDDGAALLIAILIGHGQPVLYSSARTVHGASAGYRGRGEGKTDARDALVIADQARMRCDVNPIAAADPASAALGMLTARRADLVCDRTRTINCLRGVLTSMFPPLERVMKLTNDGPLVLLAGYQTPAARRRMGAKRLENWLRTRKVGTAAALAAAAIEAAERHSTPPSSPKR